jgi:hypothetical protein
MTLRDIIKTALRKIGVLQPGEEPAQQQVNDALFVLQDIVDEWSNKRLMIHTVKPYYFPTLPNKDTYSLGPGGDWDLPRPMSLLKAKWMYQPGVVNGIETGIALDLKKLDYTWYSDIRNRGIQSQIPQYIFTDGDYPTREVKLWFVPNVPGTVETWLWQPIDVAIDLDEELSLPQGYERALIYTAAVDLCPEYGKEVTPVLDALKKQSLAAVSRKNIDVPHPTRDKRLPSNRDGAFNYITGRVGPDYWQV